MKKLRINTPTILVSISSLFQKPEFLVRPYEFPNHGTYVTFKICQGVKATTYISGQSGPKFLDTKIFMENNIKVINHSLNFKPYPQFDLTENDFIPGLSVVDLLFNCGPKASSYIGKNSVFS